MPSNVSTTSSSSPVNDDERERQIKQAEMIRQYLLVNSVETSPNRVSEENVKPRSPTKPEGNFPVNSEPVSFPFDIHDMRQELKLAEERVERLRQELKDLQSKRDEQSPRSPPAYVSPQKPISPSHEIHLSQQATPTQIQKIHETPTPPLSFIQDLRDIYSSSQINSNLNTIDRLTSIKTREMFKDQLLFQFLLTMNQHRQQITTHLESLKQTLNSLDRLASMEPTRTEVQFNNIKYEIIQEKTRQIQALKSGRSSQRSPFIENRVRQLEAEVVKLIDEHQRDVQVKAELNGQRSSMLLKIMQANNDLTMVDQQIQQIVSTNTSNLIDLHRSNMSSPSSDFNPSSLSDVFHGTNVNYHPDGRRAPFRELTDAHSLTKFTSAFYRHAI